MHSYATAGPYLTFFYLGGGGGGGGGGWGGANCTAHRRGEGGAQSCEAVISLREARKIFLRILLSDQEALS